MAAKFKKTEIGWNFRCPGCEDVHQLTSAIWTFNGDFEAPTVRASVLVTSGHYIQPRKEGARCWCTYNAEKEAKGEKRAPFECYLCHSWITDGKIQFLDDCTHALVGQTVNLPDWDA